MTPVDFLERSLALLDGHILAVALITLGAGIVKGSIGFGLPLVGVSLLSSVVSVPLAVATLTLPILVGNLWQGIQGHRFLATVRRYWPVILALGVGVVAGARLLVTTPESILLFLVGGVVILYVALELASPVHHSRLTPALERPLGVTAGLVGGLLGGLSTAWGPPILMYLSAQRLARDQFVSTVGVIWFFGSLFLIVSFSSLQILTGHTAVISAMAVLPVMAGMFIGQWLRRRINQRRFQRLVLIALTLVGLNLLRRALY